ncbi:hypothetical protein E2C01_022710 [Portunus trituberculatus]|uniref:Uncharacterized protein n=1 Tax=Portunus trituberculatus TaxID=210409 RepID=A0A5B7E8C7_PORTR|nr:hypothetical protein [Portunus trituberculatus]
MSARVILVLFKVVHRGSHGSQASPSSLAKDPCRLKVQHESCHKPVNVSSSSPLILGPADT